MAAILNGTRVDIHQSQLKYRETEKRSGGGCSPRGLLLAFLVVIGLAVIGLFVVIIISMNRHGDSTDELAGLVTAMAQELTRLTEEIQDRPTQSLPCLTPDCVQVAGDVLTKMDLTQDPCHDFYEFSCAGFAQNPNNPQDKAIWDSIRELSQANLVRVNRLLKVGNKDEEHGVMNSATAKSRRYYKVCMDETSQQTTKGEPLLQLMTSLGSWTLTSGVARWNESTWNIEDALVRSHHLLNFPIMHCGVEQDSKNASVNRIACDQGQLLLSARHYYTGNNTAVYQQAMLKTITDLVFLLDGSNATEMATDIWELDQALANAQASPEERSSYVDLYHQYTVNELQGNLGESINVSLLLRGLIGQEIPTNETIIVFAPEYFKQLTNITKMFSKETVNNYIQLTIAKSMLGYMSSEFQDLLYSLNELLYGSKREMVLWEKCTNRAVSALGFAVGALFADEHFPQSEKQRVNTMVEQIRQSFKESVAWLDWMDDETKAMAMEKADQMVTKIGYPDFILDPIILNAYYELLNVTDDAFLNAVHTRQFNAHKEVEVYGKPVDRERWFMHPTVVNAYYNPGLNEMVYPAGILQAPFYHHTYPRSMVFGAIGMVIGHELTHGFDNSGRRYDATGNVNDWWRNSSAVEFQKKSECFVEQYSKYLVHGEPHNGKLTLGENIADNGGMRLSYRAYQNWLELNNNEDILLPGLNMSHEQLFFLGYSQLWCAQATREFQLYLLKWDNHSNGKYRVLGVFMNMEEFSNAFQCPANSQMNPTKKCSLWQ